MNRAALLAIIICVLVGCRDTSGGDAPDTATDAVLDTNGQQDTTEATDASEVADDALETTETIVLTDTTDTTVPEGTRTEWGTITGACGTVTAALASPEPVFLRTIWTFDSSSFDPSPLDPGPRRRYDGPNAGGSSICSEVMSMQLLIACEDAEFYKREVEILYDETGAITDYAVKIEGDIIGVSVTRAYLGPFEMNYTPDDADTLLVKKLEGVLESTQNVSDVDRWTKQVLHIWTLNDAWVDTLETVWEGLDAATKADTIVLVTVESGSDFVVTDSCDD